MDIGIIIIAGVILFVIVMIGGGAMFWFFLGSKPKKMSWKAYVYQRGDGIIKSDIRNKKGEIVIKYQLSDLKEYGLDTIVKLDKKDGSTNYWLTKLKKPTPVVTADCVEKFGDKEKFVRVLLEEGSCTLLKAGYDRVLGKILFRPMPHERVNMIMTESSERKARIEDTRDILAQITPFVVVGIAMLALVVIAYFMTQGAVKVAEIFDTLMRDAIASQEQIAALYINALNCEIPMDREIKEEDPPMMPP